MAARVFICEPVNQRIDLADAKRFGEVITLFPLHKRRASLWNEQFREQDLPRALDENKFDPATDYLCVAGHMATQSIVIASIVLRYGMVQLLLFDTHTQEYRLIRVGDCKHVTSVSDACGNGCQLSHPIVH